MEPKLTDRSKRVLALAGEFATECGHQFVGTEHLLAGLIRENQGVASTVLRNLGVMDQIMPELTRLLSKTNVPTAEGNPS